MRQSGKNVETAVPPGPGNPLGPVFIRFGDPALGLGMHGTNVPSSVPGFRSHGCVRLRSPDAFTASSDPPDGSPDFFGSGYTDAQGAHWQEINLQALSQQPQFLSISA